MEVIHSGNCDCPFPGRGCAWEVPAAFPGQPRPPRAQGAGPGPVVWPDPVGPGALSGGGRGRCGALARASPPPAAAAAAVGRPGGPAAPRPPSPLLQLHFLFAASRPRSLPGPGSRRRPRASRRLPACSAPPPASPKPAPGLGARAGPRPREAGVAGGPAGGTARPRCLAPGGAARPSALPLEGSSSPKARGSARHRPGGQRDEPGEGLRTRAQLSSLSRRAPSGSPAPKPPARAQCDAFP